MTTTSDSDFHTCPFHEGPVVSKCTLEACDLWLPKHELCCGFVAYRKRISEGPEELSWEAIGEILGYEAREVEHLSRQAYEILRQLAVQSRVTAEWSLLRGATRCIVCNTCLEGKEGTVSENGWGWCSESCYQWLPPAAVEAEARWGTWFRKLLVQWRQLNVKTIERLTGLNKETIRWLLWQHLGWGETEAETNQWLRHDKPLIPNPKIPQVVEIIRRIEAADRWGSEK